MQCMSSEKHDQADSIDKQTLFCPVSINTSKYNSICTHWQSIMCSTVAFTKKCTFTVIVN